MSSYDYWRPVLFGYELRPGDVVTWAAGIPFKVLDIMEFGREGEGDYRVCIRALVNGSPCPITIDIVPSYNVEYVQGKNRSTDQHDCT